MKIKFKKYLILTFILLYIAVGFVSTYHAVSFFSIANQIWLAIILAIAFELGQASALLSLITSKTSRSKIMPWVLMIILTSVQVMGNVFASYKHIMENDPNAIKYFHESILFWIHNVNPQIYNVVVVWIIGALLPIIALGLTGLVAEDFMELNIKKKEENKIEQPIKQVKKRKVGRPKKSIKTNNKEEVLLTNMQETNNVSKEKQKGQQFWNR